jgi:dolichol-phosphate mannosyltransferase
LNVSFSWAQLIATLFAMTGNFIFNNLIMYCDKRLCGWQLLRGWTSFTLICSVGAFGNVGVAAFLFVKDFFW